jgi:hypothetical protein
MSDARIPRIYGNRKPRLFVHEWMKHKGLNQVDIANRLEISSTGTISKKLAKPEKLTVEWLAKFAWALDIDPEQLYRHPDQPSPDELLRQADPSTKEVVLRILNTAKRA